MLFSSSFQGIKNKNKLVLQLMEQLVYPNPTAYRDTLIRFSTLNHTNYSEVCLVPLCVYDMFVDVCQLMMNLYVVGAQGESIARADQIK